MTEYPGTQSPKRRRDIVPILVGPVALAAFAAGVMLWGTLFSAVVSGVEGLFDDVAGDDGGVQVEPVGGVDCEAFGPERTPTAEERPAVEAQCETPTPEAPEETPTPVPPTPTATIAPTDENRFNCDQIRGTSYLSEDERGWFLENCLTPTP